MNEKRVGIELSIYDYIVEKRKDESAQAYYGAP